MKSDVDVAVIGAGAAGLAAALSLAGQPLEIVVLEARDRIGGRAHTARPMQDLPIDLGCGWLHSADQNPLVPLVEARGFEIDRGPSPWGRQTGDLGFSRQDRASYAQAFAAFDARLEQAATAKDDRPAADFLIPGDRWNSLIQAVSTYYNGVELEAVSVFDYAAYRDTEMNWRVRDGYGAAVAALGQPVRVTLNCAVTRIDHSEHLVRLLTSQGDLRARAVVVTVPTPHLAQERLALWPRLPDKVEAAAQLPLGLADKAFLLLGRPEAVPADGHWYGRTDRIETASYGLRPLGRPVVEAYVGGQHARSLERQAPGAIAAFAIEELRALAGADFVRMLRPFVETAWDSDPWSLGAYSHALPGGAGARRVLAEPVDGRLFWAGEATHPSAFSTAHGAWESGIRAADEALRALKSA